MIKAENVIAAMVGDDDGALGARHVNGRADRRLQRDAEKAASGRDQPDVGLRPMPTGDKIDVDERPEKIADVRRQEIQRVERMGNGQHRRGPV